MSANRREHQDDVFARAKELSLCAFIERELGVSGRASGQWMRYSACPGCGEGPKGSVRLAVKDERTFICHRCKETGSIIDAAILHWGLSGDDAALQAAYILVGERPEARIPKAREIDRTAEAEEQAKRRLLLKRAFSKLQQACEEFRNEPNCLRYLVEKRALPIDLIREAQSKGIIGFMPADQNRAKQVMVSAIGEDLLRDTGLWKPDSKLPGICYRPLIGFMPGMTSAEFRVIVESDWSSKSIAYGPKEYPYWWEGSEPQCLITEGWIDMLSGVALGFRGHGMGLPGCNNIREYWLKRAAETHDIKRYVIGLDNDVDQEDNPGQTWAVNIKKMVDEIGIPCFIKKPPKGDINDILVARELAKRKGQ